MEIIHKYNNFKRSSKEVIPNYDVVDRTGFISNDMQFERLRSAGTTLTRIRTEQYSYVYDEVVEAMNNSNIRELVTNTLMQNAHYDKRDVDDMYKSKLDKYVKAKSSNDMLSGYYKEFNNLQSKRKEDEKTLKFYNDVYSALRQLKDEGKI